MVFDHHYCIHINAIMTFPLADATSVCRGSFNPLRMELAGLSVLDIAGAQWNEIREMVPTSSRPLFAILHRQLSIGSLKSTNLIGNVLNFSQQITPGFLPDPDARLHMDTLKSKMTELSQDKSVQLRVINFEYNNLMDEDMSNLLASILEVRSNCSAEGLIVIFRSNRFTTKVWDLSEKLLSMDFISFVDVSTNPLASKESKKDIGRLPEENRRKLIIAPPRHVQQANVVFFGDEGSSSFVKRHEEYYELLKIISRSAEQALEDQLQSARVEQASMAEANIFRAALSFYKAALILLRTAYVNLYAFSI